MVPLHALLVALGMPVLASQTAAPNPPAVAPLELELGKPVVAEVRADSPLVHSPTLDATHSDAPVRGIRFRATLPAGAVTLELKSYFFDAYLVVRNEDGSIAAEDDDGLLRQHARVVLDLSGSRTVDVSACALHGGTGAFEIQIRAGRPLPLTGRARIDAEIEDARREVEARERVLGPNHLETARSLHNLAALQVNFGRFEGARPLLERALSIKESALGPESPDVAISLHALADLLREEGDFEEARRRFKRALEICEKVQGPEDPLTALSLNNLAELLVEEGKYEEARPLHERALRIREKVLGTESLETAESLNNLGCLLRNESQLEQARPLAVRALRICEKMCGPEHLGTATKLNNLAEVLIDEGKYEEARPLHERALRIYERELGPECENVACSLNNVALLLRMEGKREEARPLLERALRIREKVFGPDHAITAISVGNLGTFLLDEGRLEEARVQLERALRMREKALDPEHPDVVVSLANLANCRAKQGEFEKARPLCERALRISETKLGPEHLATARSLNNLAELLWDEGRLEEARPLLERELRIEDRVQGREHPDTASTVIELARLDLDRGDRVSASTLARHYLASMRTLWSTEAEFASENDACFYLANLQDSLDLSLAVAAPEDRASDDFYDDVLSIKGIVFRLLRGRRGSGIVERDPELLRVVERLRGVRSELSNLFVQREVPDRAQFDRNVERLRKERVALETSIARAASERRSSPPMTARRLRELLPDGVVLVDLLEHREYALPPKKNGRAVGAGHWSDLTACAWISQSGATAPVWIDLGPCRAIEKAIAIYLDAIGASRGASAPVDAASSASAATELRRLVWDPLASQVGDAKRVLLRVEGTLATLPFGLIVDASGHHLIERHEFVCLEDLGGLERALDSASEPVAQAATGRPPSLLAAGAIDYETGAALASGLVASSERRGAFTRLWDPLSLTGSEADGVLARHQRRFPDAPRLLLMQDAPTEERLKAELPNYSVLHLATHGYFLAEGLKSITDSIQESEDRARFRTDERELLAGYWPEMLCGLVCAGANHPRPERDNGLLTGDEVSALDLSRCELVVLSACETALGRRQAGEGLVSLTRSFRLAGAKTVISSLWQVRDDSTQELMLDFYDRLWAKRESKSDALRHAQLDMLEHNRARNGDTRPATWGAFVLTGQAE